MGSKNGKPVLTEEQAEALAASSGLDATQVQFSCLQLYRYSSTISVYSGMRAIQVQQFVKGLGVRWFYLLFWFIVESLRFHYFF